MAFTVGRYGVASLLPLASLMGAFYATCLLFVFGVLGSVAALAGFSICRLIAYIKDEILIVLGTSSSEAALPNLIAKLEGLGCAESVTGLVIPTGYSFNLDGTCIYLVMATVFLAQATNTPLTVMHQLAIIGVLLITSKGAAGVAGAAFIVLAATLASLGTIPVASITLILGIHRFMGEAISITNLIGNAVATIVVSKWDGALDEKRLAAVLGGRPRVETVPSV
jgi:aerobic C4-dicarboxylate transport protein